MNANIEKLFEKPLKLPTKQKIALLLLILILEGGLFFYLLQLPKYKELNSLKEKLSNLDNQIQENRKVANNLPRLKLEYEQLKHKLELALTELPNEKEIPSLLTSITTVGKNAGLDFLLFKPKPEQPKEFYAEVPVDIAVAGTYYNVANFFVAVSNLPRIVNLNDVSVTDIKDIGGKARMKVTCLATTFRFMEKKEANDDKNKKKK